MDKKPRIRKTKEELIIENEMNFSKKKGPLSMRTGSQGFNRQSGYDSKGFHKPVLDPKMIQTNKKFDDIPDEPKQVLKLPSKPKPIKAPLKKDQKFEKEITEKLTNIRIDTKTNTAQTVERNIERIRAEPKEVTQKPNFGKFTPKSNQQQPTYPPTNNPYIQQQYVE